jgi:hypothetical protein
MVAIHLKDLFPFAFSVPQKSSEAASTGIVQIWSTWEEPKIFLSPTIY